jgi:Fe2+ or Zn2+ uptake regulation protein
MVYTEEAFKAELNARGWRATRQREIILQTFKTYPRGLTECRGAAQEVAGRRS